MAKYTLNQAAVAHCRRLIDARQYVLDSDWGDVQPQRRGRRTPFWRGIPGTSTPPGISASPRVRPTRPRRATRSSTATSAGCTGPA